MHGDIYLHVLCESRLFYIQTKYHRAFLEAIYLTPGTSPFRKASPQSFQSMLRQKPDQKLKKLKLPEVGFQVKEQKQRCKLFWTNSVFQQIDLEVTFKRSILFFALPLLFL